MCTNGIDIRQLEQMIDHIDDHISLEYRWSHKLAHAAGDVGLTTASEKLHAAQSMLAEVRSVLDEAKSALEFEAGSTPVHDITVHRLTA